MGHTKFLKPGRLTVRSRSLLQVKWQKPVKNLNGAREYIKA